MFSLLNFCYLLGNEHVETVDIVEQFILFLQRIFLYRLTYLIKHLFILLSVDVLFLVWLPQWAGFLMLKLACGNCISKI